MKTEPQECLLQFGAKQIPYRLHRAGVKRLRIVVSPDLTVDAHAPLGVDERRVHAAVLKKAPWIAKVLDKLESYHPLPTLKKYVSGETFVYLGRQYRLKVTDGTKKVAKLNGRFLQVEISDKNRAKRVKQAVRDWYRSRAAEVFRRYIDKCYAIASRHGVPIPSLSVRTMRRRWGSCSGAKRITLNLNLVQVPVHCVEYVIMHELCHLRYSNHSRQFYSLLNRCQP